MLFFTVYDDVELARYFDYAGADWPVVKQRSGGQDDLSE